MKKITKSFILVFIVAFLLTSIAFAGYVLPKYAKGMVKDFTDSSRAGHLDVTSIVPSPGDKEHKFTAVTVTA